jgi:hypothetical protein
VTHAQINSPIKDVAMAIVTAIAAVKAVEELAIAPHQVIKALLRIL